MLPVQVLRYAKEVERLPKYLIELRVFLHRKLGRDVAFAVRWIGTNITLHKRM